MPVDLWIIPIDAITFSDIDQLVAEQIEEGPRVEFKEALPTSDGQPDRWMKDQSAIGRVARDDIAKEVVAFANAYGGIIIIGIEETNDNPKRAKAIASPEIPSVVDCGERLIRALRAVIDPPLPMLEVRGIPSGAAGDGVVFIRVNPSPLMPHGVGRPSEGYVRRGADSEPLMMRDLQSMFFEARTRLERVQARQSDQSRSARDLWGKWKAGGMPKRYREDAPFKPKQNALLFRCTLTPLISMDIDNFPDRFLAVNRPSPQPDLGETAALVQLPQSTSDWRRRYRSVECIGNSGEMGYWEIKLDADGSVNQVSLLGTIDEPLKIFVGWYARVALQGMILTEWLRQWAGRPDVEYVLDGEFMNVGAHVEVNPTWREFEPVPWSSYRLGPYSVGSPGSFQQIFDVIEPELWDMFGLKRLRSMQFDMTTALAAAAVV
jgi:hypothetical protein